MDNKCFLIVEDDEPKLSSINGFLVERFPGNEIVIARSLSSAVAKLDDCKIDVAIIDMSLPTYDFAIDKAGGGQPQGFGGADILRFISTESPGTVALVITQYEEFPDAVSGKYKSLEDLRNELVKEFGDGFLGLVYYSGQRGTWRDEVSEMIGKEFDR